MKKITTLLLMGILIFISNSAFAGDPIERLKKLVTNVEKHQKVLVDITKKLPSRDKLTEALRVGFIEKVHTAESKWTTKYNLLTAKLIKTEVIDDPKVQQKLSRLKVKKPILNANSQAYLDNINTITSAQLDTINNHWASGQSRKTWYVDMVNGLNDGYDGLSVDTPFKTTQHLFKQETVVAGDTVVLVGEHKNEDFADENIWKTSNTIRISSLHGDADNYITIKPYDKNTLLKGNAQSVLRIIDSSYIRVEGFRIKGEVENISIATAKKYQFLYKTPAGEIKYRVPKGSSIDAIAKMKFKVLGDTIQRPSATDTKGIYVSNSHHIDLVANTISYMPGTGLRVAKGDYLNITDNEVHHCSMRSYAGTHALVVHSSKSIDKNDDHKIKILRNSVHHNYNGIFSWSPLKDKIVPHIDEGKGISLQKNSAANGWRHGRILVANNLTYWNGLSGINNNGGDRLDFVYNTCFYNSYTGTITNNGNSSGKNIGISTSEGKDVNIINNIIVTDTALNGFAIAVVDTKKLTVSNNLIIGTLDNDFDDVDTQTIYGQPNFANTDTFDFKLLDGSNALAKATALTYVTKDKAGLKRGRKKPDLGAWEY